MWQIAWLMMVLFGGHDGKEPTDRLIPADWQGNPWGPEATRARAGGEIPPVAQTPTMKQWDAWGKAVLRDGDIVFRRGDARILFGRFPFSRFLALASNSRFSHTGIVAIEGGEPVVYDTTKDGVQRQPFCVWLLDNVGPLGVKRVRPEDRAYAARAVAYCRELFAQQPPFDFKLGIDDAAYYCVEMTEKAYRSGGMALSEPVRLGDMENITRYPICVLAAVGFAHLSLEQRVYLPGNTRHGIWSCPRLVTVYESGPTLEERRDLIGRLGPDRGERNSSERQRSY
jgi:hypothetical protein